MISSSKSILNGYCDTIVDKNTFLLLLNQGDLYNVNEEKEIGKIEYIPEKCALKGDNLVCVYHQNIFVHNLRDKTVKKLQKILKNSVSSIYYDEMLVIGCYGGEIVIFDLDFEFIESIEIGLGHIPVILNSKIGLIAICSTGELLIYKDGNSKTLEIGGNLTALTVRYGDIETKTSEIDGSSKVSEKLSNCSEDKISTQESKENESELNLSEFKQRNTEKQEDSMVEDPKRECKTVEYEIIVGDRSGFLHFIEPSLSMHKRKISSYPIEYLFFHNHLYCITEGFVRKIHRNGARKIYGTVCSDPNKVFEFKNQVFCASLMVGVLPLIDRDEDLYDKIMKFK